MGGRRTQVASALHAARGAAVSGEVLAGALGISRAAVAKHVAALRDLGYVIEAVPGEGYRLVSAPDACIPEEVAPRLSDPLWVECTGGLETASTNDDAKRLAASGAPDGTVVVAARQTAGRGRLGREWSSPPGGVYASVVLRPVIAPSEIGPLPLVVGLGVAQGLESLGVGVRLKWPNDLVLSGRKVGGVLLETAAESDRVNWVVAGIGINVAAPAGPDSAYLREVVPDLRVAEVAASVLDGVASVYRSYLAFGFGVLREEYLLLGTLWGRAVVVRNGAGFVIAEGEAQGVDDQGALILADESGLTIVSAGEVTLRSLDR